MGVIPVGNKKYFTFDGETSKNYYTHITGAGVFNAPVRAVEMVNIPNRNGAFALDQGYFENVELKYEASIVADSDAEFAQAVSDLRNWLCSKKGYCRLEDDYNPNEYRMAVYKSGLEVEPFLARTGKFDIVFDCKPQRFLTSGETAVAVASGGKVTNPTLFDAKPLLEISGYGAINVNGYEIEIFDELVGDVVIDGSKVYNFPRYIQFPEVRAVYGDGVDINGLIINAGFYYLGGGLNNDPYITDVSIVSHSYSLADGATRIFSSDSFALQFVAENTVSWTKGNSLIKTRVGEIIVDISLSNGTTIRKKIEASCKYDDDYTFVINVEMENMGSLFRPSGIDSSLFNSLVVHSTATTFGQPTYIDCDIGEAYSIDNGVFSSLNQYISLGSELPILSSGENTITYDNTVTQLKVTPRWWRV